jgi:hypothetical protein
MCVKTPYTSERQAKAAHRRNGRRRGGVAWRFRAYWCHECRAYHMTNAEKR